MSTKETSTESKPIDTSTIGGRIKALRKEYKITQEQLRELLNMSSENKKISKIENGHTEPSCWELVKMSEIFHTTTDYLLTGRKDPPKEDALPTLTPAEQAFIVELAEKIQSFKSGN